MEKTPEELAAEEAGLANMGRHLRQLRTGKDWRQEDLAEKSGISVATIRAIEKHPPERRYNKDTLKKLSVAFDKPDDYLLRYQQEHRAAEPGSQPAAVIVQPPRSVGRRAALRADEIMPQIDEILVSRLNEMVMPWLKEMKEQVRLLADALHRIQGIQADGKDRGEAE